jgi:hypothetical protein
VFDDPSITGLTVQEILDRFHKVFDREMTAEERRIFFVEALPPLPPKPINSKPVLPKREVFQ